MMTQKPKLLYVTDLHYQSKGRVYYEEDMGLSSRLSSDFSLVLCHPQAATAFMDDVDVVLFRNTGPVMYFQDAYEALKTKAVATETRIFNELLGKADMRGKQYLVDLSREGYPVIPSVDRHEELDRLPAAKRYVSKLKQGADSIGMTFISSEALENTKLYDNIVQPVIEFSYEVSFYFINHDFQYALYAPDPHQRWKLVPYDATEADLEFALDFIQWNDINYGIQRIDACRLPDGKLLLMEIEDINPYLSLDLLADDVRNRFVENLKKALTNYINK